MSTYRCDFPGGGTGWITGPDEVLHQLGPDWTKSTGRQRLWYELSRPRFSWVELVIITLLVVASRAVVG